MAVAVPVDKALAEWCGGELSVWDLAKCLMAAVHCLARPPRWVAADCFRSSVKDREVATAVLKGCYHEECSGVAVLVGTPPKAIAHLLLKGWRWDVTAWSLSDPRAWVNAIPFNQGVDVVVGYGRRTAEFDLPLNVRVDANRGV